MTENTIDDFIQEKRLSICPICGEVFETRQDLWKHYGKCSPFINFKGE